MSFMAPRQPRTPVPSAHDLPARPKLDEIANTRAIDVQEIAVLIRSAHDDRLRGARRSRAGGCGADARGGAGDPSCAGGRDAGAAGCRVPDPTRALGAAGVAARARQCEAGRVSRGLWVLLAVESVPV